MRRFVVGVRVCVFVRVFMRGFVCTYRFGVGVWGIGNMIGGVGVFGFRVVLLFLFVFFGGFCG